MAKEKEEEKNIESAIEFLRREYNCVADLSATKKEFPHVSSGSDVIDLLSGIGGFPKRRLCEVAGEFSSGKTTLAIQTAVNVQKEGKIAVFVDWEQALDPFYAQALGLDIKDVREGGKFLLVVPDNLEEGWEATHRLVKFPEVGIVILDSVSSMIPKSVVEDPEVGTGRIGLQAALLAPQFQKLVNECRESGCVALALNQVRMKFTQTRFGMQVSETTSGGNALTFLTTMRVWLKITGTIEGVVPDPVSLVADKGIVANVVSAYFKKNKLAAPFKRGQFYVRFGEGIDNVSSLIDVAVERKLITQSGAYFLVKGHEKNIQGKEPLRLLVKSDVKLRESLMKEVGWTE